MMFIGQFAKIGNWTPNKSEEKPKKNKPKLFLLIFLLLASALFADTIKEASLTSTKVANYSYEIKDELGNAVLQDTVINKIDAKNQILDCDILTCDYKINITAKQSLSFDLNTLKGAYDGKGASVQKIFYQDTQSVKNERPIYKDVIEEQCLPPLEDGKNTTICENVTTQKEIGTETYFVNESFENTALDTPFSKDEIRTYVIRFTKDNPNDVVDIYHIIYGQERKEGAWWNASFAKCNRITFTNNITTGDTGEIVSNLFNYSNFQANGTDIRIINGNGVDCSTAGSEEFTHYVLDWNNPKDNRSIVGFKATNTTNSVLIFYNNSVATDTGNCSAVYLLADNFNRADSNTVGIGQCGMTANWTRGGTKPDGAQINNNTMQWNFYAGSGGTPELYYVFDSTLSKQNLTLRFNTIDINDTTAASGGVIGTNTHAPIWGAYEGSNRSAGNNGKFMHQNNTNRYGDALAWTYNIWYDISAQANWEQLIGTAYVNDTLLNTTTFGNLTLQSVYFSDSYDGCTGATCKNGSSALDNVRLFNGVETSVNTFGAEQTNGGTAPILAYTNSSVANNSILPHNYAYFEINYTEANRANTTLNLNPSGGVSWCYQDRADVATLCGGLNNGTYSTVNYDNPTLVYDANYSSYSSGTTSCGGGNTCMTALVNFTLPAYGQNTSLWMPKDTTGLTTTTQNISIVNCSLAPLQLKAYQVSYGLGGADTTYSCYNGTGWQQLKKNSDAIDGVVELYEVGAMWWNISIPVTATSYEMTCNTTICYYNITSLIDGHYNASVTMNNTGGLSTTLGIINFTIAGTPPAITILSPTNKFYNTTNISLNFVAVDSNLDSCLYRLNGNATTVALPNCTNTTFIGLQGINNLTVYANDSFGLESNASVSFTIDTINPAIAIQIPANGTTYSTVSVPLNYTVSDANLNKCWWYAYMISMNISTGVGGGIIANCSNTTLNATSWLAYSPQPFYLTVYANDSAGNTNASATVAIFVNTGTPSITIQSPTNKTYGSTSVDLNYTATDAVAMDKCWYKLDAGANTSLSNCSNITLTSLGQGGHTVTVYVNNTGGNFNSSSVSFGVDTVNPAITIQSPTATNYNTTNISLNYIASDTNRDKCWYKLNAGANTSLTNCGNTTFIAAQGSNTITVYVNDTVNNFNSSSVTFFVDSINPFLTVQSPIQNLLYNTSTNISLSYIASDTNRDKCWYNLNANATNVSLASCANTTFIALLGANSITIYVNDTLNNLNSSTIAFTVNPNDSITIHSPINTIYNHTLIDLNYTVTGLDIDKCWYSLNGATNITLSNCSNTTFTGIEGVNQVIAYTNNTLNVTASSSVSFTIDTTNPQISIQSPTATNYTTTNISLNYTASDANKDTCWYVLNGGSNVILASCLNTTFTATQGSNTIVVHVNDTANNQNSSSVTFTVDNIPPIISMTSPLAQYYPNNTVSLIYTVSDAVSGVDKCWYVLDANPSVQLSGCSNTSLSALAQGNHTITLYANDTFGNSNSTARNFGVNFIPPIISISSPSATTYTTNTTPLNISISYSVNSLALDSCWYVLDGGASVPLPGCGNTSYLFTNTSHILVIYANDTLGSIGSNSVSFTVQIGTPPIPTPEGGLEKMLDGISNSFSEIIGSPIFLGMIVLLLFLGWIAVSGMRGDGKAVIMAIAATLALAFFPSWFAQIIEILAGLVIVAAILKLVGRW